MRELAAAMGAKEPDMLGDWLLLLIEGIYVTGQLAENGPAQAAAAMAERMIEASLPDGR